MADILHDQLIDTLPSLKAFATMLTRDRQRAEDLVQDTVVRALARSELFQPGTNFKAWTFTIMRNHYIDTMRQQKREALTEVGDEVLQNMQVTAANQEHRMVLQDLMRALGNLSDEQREVLSLVVVNGMAYEEAATITGCPIGTIRSRLARARRELERALTGETAAEAPVRQPALVRTRTRHLQHAPA